MKRTVEIDDTLQDRVDSAISETEESLMDYLSNYPETDSDLDIEDLNCRGMIDQIIDGCVPVYYHEINTIWYLHGDRIEEAYENAGIGENPRENSGMTAIYLYISDKVYQWYADNAEAIIAGKE